MTTDYYFILYSSLFNGSHTCTQDLVMISTASVHVVQAICTLRVQCGHIVPVGCGSTDYKW